MRITDFELKNYRNCIDVSGNLNHEKTLIIGKNGQGKTNILEALYFLSTLKSPRTSNIKDFINFNADEFSIKAEIEKINSKGVMQIDCNKQKGSTVPQIP